MNPHTLGKWLVALQFGLLAAMGVLCLQKATEHLPGMSTYVLWLCGVAIGLLTLSANRPGNFNIRPEPKEHSQLVKTGPYRWVRHPMYSSVLLLAAGASFWLMSLIGAVLWLALLAVLTTKASLEETWLLQRYSEYAAYRTQTWRLVPWIY